MTPDEQMRVLAKGRDAVSFVLKTTPNMLNNPDAVRELHDALPAPVQPAWPEPRALPTLQTESE